MIIPPRLGLVMLAIVACLWSQQHPTLAYADSSWILPVSPPARLVGKYQAPATLYAAGHRGIDYLVTEGQPILAPSDGQVRFVGVINHKPVVSISHSGGYITSFEPLCSKLTIGSNVTKGQVLGQICGSGYRSHCQKLCLHYGMRIGKDYLSPLALAGALAPSHIIR